MRRHLASQAPTDTQLGTILDMKRSLLTMRKVITP